MAFVKTFSSKFRKYLDSRGNQYNRNFPKDFFAVIEEKNKKKLEDRKRKSLSSAG